MYNNFLDLVKERPDPTLTLDNKKCPFCDSSNIKETDHSMTLVGGDRDYNHHWRNHVCNACNKEFIIEHKLDFADKNPNIWYVDRITHKVLKGIPSCFESYIYTCSKCNGAVHRIYTALDGITEVKYLLTNAEGKQY
jgi:hypothetical protein